MSEQAVTAQSEDFSRWYNEIVYRADLAAPSPVRGCVIIKPYGYEIWEGIKDSRTAALRKPAIKMPISRCLSPKAISSARRSTSRDSARNWRL